MLKKKLKIKNCLAEVICVFPKMNGIHRSNNSQAVEKYCSSKIIILFILYYLSH